MSDKPEETEETPDEAGEEAHSLDELAARQDRTEGKLDEILAMLKGRPDAGSRDGQDHADIAELVRQGVEKIEADKARLAEQDAKAQADQEWRSKVDKAIEAKPSEPRGRVRAAVQKYGFGIRD